MAGMLSLVVILSAVAGVRDLRTAGFRRRRHGKPSPSSSSVESASSGCGVWTMTLGYRVGTNVVVGVMFARSLVVEAGGVS